MHLLVHSSRLLAFQMLLLEHISTTAVVDHLRVKISPAVSADLLLEKFSMTAVID